MIDGTPGPRNNRPAALLVARRRRAPLPISLAKHRRRRPPMIDLPNSVRSGFNRRTFIAATAGGALTAPLPSRAGAAPTGTSSPQDLSLPVNGTLRVNGEDRPLSIDARTTLL